MSAYKLDTDKVRKLAFVKGMSMSGLCEKAGMNRSRATDWKYRSVSPRTVFRIAQVLEVDPYELVEEEKTNGQNRF